MLPDINPRAISIKEDPGKWTTYFVNNEMRYRVDCHWGYLKSEVNGRAHLVSQIQKYDPNTRLWLNEFPEVPEAAILARIIAEDDSVPFWGSPSSPRHHRTLVGGTLYEVQPRKDIRQWYPNRNEWVAVNTSFTPNTPEELLEIYKYTPDR